MKRVRVRASWFSRGVYCNPEASGWGGWTGYPISGKEVAAEWLAFYKTAENFVP
jgi:hypothetical protein